MPQTLGDNFKLEQQAINTSTFDEVGGSNRTLLSSVGSRDRRLSRKRWSDTLNGAPFDTAQEQSSTGGLVTSAEAAKDFQNETGLKGTPSLMNAFSLTTLGLEDNSVIMDKAGVNTWYEDKNNVSSDINQTGFANNATTDAIIQNSQNNDSMGKRPYVYSDFAFTKYWNKIPNNRLVTLRRFGLPVNDSLTFPSENDGGIEYRPVAQAITYMGEEPGNQIANLLGFKSGVPWKDIKAQVMEVGQTKDAMGDTGQGIGSKIGRTMSMLTGAANKDDIRNNGELPPDPYKDGPYNNVILGPVNRIDTTKGRAPGIIFEQPITLNFHYMARPIGGINTKAVMLDILANLLVLTGAEAAFWGGMHRFRIANPKYPFAGGLLGRKGQEQMFSGDSAGFFDTMMDGLASGVNNFVDAFSNMISGGGFKEIFSKGLGIAAAKKFAGKKPYLTGFNALLTGNPVGEWHLTIGNPLNPMIEMGNMICTGMDIKFSEEMGPDDFPLEMTATITLDHGMPRDIAAIQSMFNKGQGKIYSLPDELQWLGAKAAKAAGVDAATTAGIGTDGSLGASDGAPTIRANSSGVGTNASNAVKMEVAHGAKTVMGYASNSLNRPAGDDLI